MQTIFQCVTQNAWLLAFVGAHFVYYALPAWAVLAVRLGARRVRKGELLLLVSFLICVGLEIIQLATNGKRAFGTGSIWGYARYFGALAPLLWVWAAVLLAFLWQLGTGCGRFALRLGVIAVVAWVFHEQCYGFFAEQFTCSAGEDAWVAAKRVAPIIKADYKGPKRTAVRYTGIDYFTAARPLVYSQIGAAAWEVRGASEGVRHGFRPWVKEDYLFLRVGEGYFGKTKFLGSEYDFVAKVNGICCEWWLLRRKGRW